MPDKRKVCGSGCLRCWQNRLKHANPETKKYMKKHGIESFVFPELPDSPPQTPKKGRTTTDRLFGRNKRVKNGDGIAV